MKKTLRKGGIVVAILIMGAVALTLADGVIVKPISEVSITPVSKADYNVVMTKRVDVDPISYETVMVWDEDLGANVEKRRVVAEAIYAKGASGKVLVSIDSLDYEANTTKVSGRRAFKTAEFDNIKIALITKD